MIGRRIGSYKGVAWLHQRGEGGEQKSLTCSCLPWVRTWVLVGLLQAGHERVESGSRGKGDRRPQGRAICRIEKVIVEFWPELLLPMVS